MVAWEELDHRYANQRDGVLRVKRKGFDKGICYRAVSVIAKLINALNDSFFWVGGREKNSHFQWPLNDGNQSKGNHQNY